MLATAPLPEQIVHSLVPAYLTTEERGLDMDKARSRGVGGTDIPKLLSVSPWGTPFDVWASKTGRSSRGGPASDEAEAGLFMEPFILRKFAQRYAVLDLWTPRVRFRDSREPWVTADPDALFTVNGQLVGADAKTRSPFKRKEWGDEGSDVVPPDEYCQCQWYMEVFDAEWWYLPVSFDRRIETFVLRRDRAFGEEARQLVRDFWHNHVMADTPPLPMVGKSAKHYLETTWPANINPVRDASESEVELARAWLGKRQERDRAAAALEDIENQLKASIGDADGIQGPGWKFTYKRSKDSEVTDFAAMLEELLVLHPELAEEARRLRESNTMTRPGARRFLPSKQFEVV